MPYITKEKRELMDQVVREMEMNGVIANGDLNYILFAYCVRNIPLSYNTIKNYCGELRQAATEIERRVLGPYEDIKIKENGDVE